MIQLHLGDCIEKIKDIPNNSVDSLVCDPPAGIGFMGKSWDSDKGGRKEWIAWMTEVMSECLRVMKPGAHGIVWGLPRTSHWTATALEDSGFEVRDVITHLFGQGFPKSLDISKAIYKAAGAEREKGFRPIAYSDSDCWGTPNKNKGSTSTIWSEGETPEFGKNGMIETSYPSTDAAKQWDGWGTALKPASEHWILVRKPCSEKTVAANILKWGVGGLNIDGCRIEANYKNKGGGSFATGKFANSNRSNTEKDGLKSIEETKTSGRFPANLILSHSQYCTDEQCDIECAIAMLDRQSGISKSTGGHTEKFSKEIYGKFKPKVRANSGGLGDSGGASRFFFQAKHDTLASEWVIQKNVTNNANDVENDSLFLLFRIRDFVLKNAATQNTDLKKEELQVFLDCIGSFKNYIQIQNLVSHVASLENTDTTEIIQSLWKLYGCVCDAIDKNIKLENQKNGLDQVKATRFLYSAKVSPSERGDSNHPTMKSQKLMRYLCRLITPPNGIVLDPFMGSGSTGLAAKLEGFQFIGIEKEQEYFEIAKKRIGH